jgi:cytochrome c biogenesis protein CcmG, thiol:disulfide interchange protein DsbE
MPRTLVLLAVLSAACAGSRPALRSSPLVGKSPEVVAQDLAGHTVRIADDRGRVRIVDFWATWCEPCLDQLPVLDRLAQEYGGKGLSVYAVSFDEDRALLETFLDDRPVSFTVLWDKGGARLSEALDIQRLPTTLLVDRRGVVRHVHLGFEGAAVARLERELAALLAEP